MRQGCVVAFVLGGKFVAAWRNVRQATHARTREKAISSGAFGRTRASRTPAGGKCHADGADGQGSAVPHYSLAQSEHSRQR